MKKETLITGLIGILIGVILVFVIIFLSAQSLMLSERKLNLSFEEADTLFQKTTLEKGWKLATIHDLKATMNKFGKDVKQAKVYEICHPEHAYKILSRDDERIVTTMMPCRISIYEKSDGNVYISWMNTNLMGKLMKGVVPEVMSAASKESEDIVKVLLER